MVGDDGKGVRGRAGLDGPESGGGGITTYTILEATTNGSTTSATISGLTQNKTYPL